MQLIPFDSAKVPAHIKARAGAAVNVFAAAVSSGGFPVISIKGKVFHIKRGDEKILVTKPDDPDEPAASLEVVIVAASAVLNKTFYESGYVEGSDEKPTCYSNDGIAPAADAVEAQSKKCATCAHNVWGSGKNDKGETTKGKACADVMRLAVTAAGQLNDPMLLRVPAASLKALGQYGDLLAKRGVEPKQVVTKIGFDYSVAHPALTFKPMGFVSDDMLAEIEETAASDVVKNIIGAGAVPAKAADDDEPAPRAQKDAAPEKVPAADKPARRPAAKAASLAAAEEEASAKPKAKVKVEAGDDGEATTTAKKPAAAAAATATVDDLEAALDDLDFDD